MAARSIWLTATEHVQQRVKTTDEKVTSEDTFCKCSQNVTDPVKYTEQPVHKKKTTLDDIM